jgi:glycosyltransferase involved in cell wall biosynthesis
MRIALLSGAFPPQFDGIGDHSWWLSQALVQQGHEVTVLTSFAPVREEAFGVDVVACFDASRSQTIGDALQTLRQKGRFDWLVVQYNPFCFGRRGFAPWLLPALNQSGIPLAVMFHETFAVPLWPWQQIVMRIWQYPQFALLARTGLCHFVSTERWLTQVRRWAKGPSQLLPVGSNLPLCSLTKREARERLGLNPDALILGVFGFAHQSKLIAWIGAAARAIHARFPQTEVLCIGQVGQFVRGVCDKTPVHDHGSLPGPEVSLRLRAMDVFLAPLTDGISGRRGSVVAALQHGLPICSTVRTYTDAFLKNLVNPAFSLVPHNDLTRFCEEAVRLAEKALQQPNFGQELAKFHDEHFAWPVIAKRMAMGLLTTQTAAA